MASPSSIRIITTAVAGAAINMCMCGMPMCIPEREGDGAETRVTIT